MAKRKTHTPTDPAEIARRRQEERRDPSKWGVSLEAMSLPANRDITHEPATRTKTARIQRYDVFALLHTREALPSASLVAIRRLQDGIACRMGLEGAVSYDGAPGASSRVLVSDRSLEAGDIIDAVLPVLPAVLRLLIVKLVTPSVEGARVNWRGVALMVTGEHRPRQQVNIVVDACNRLAEAYRDYDNAPKRRAA